MKNYARFRRFTADFTRLSETCGGDESILVTHPFSDVRARLQKTS
ncbi:MAG TPA: hypothetical protein VGQ54_15315 [Burkholderiales bacterium]|jgi:hypothetical protein|nr:hypothetical protein [Burkholderiales bacterium]